MRISGLRCRTGTRPAPCDSSVLPTPVGPEEQERAGRPVRIGQARARAADRVGDRARWPRPGRRRARAAASICSSLSRSPCISLATGMPVARDTTSAISSAPTSVRSSCGLPPSALLLPSPAPPSSCASSSRQLAVLQLGHLVEVALALQLLDLQSQLVDLFLDVLRSPGPRPSRPSRSPRGRRTRARSSLDLFLDQLERVASTPRPSPS